MVGGELVGGVVGRGAVVVDLGTVVVDRGTDVEEPPDGVVVDVVEPLEEPEEPCEERLDDRDGEYSEFRTLSP